MSILLTENEPNPEYTNYLCFTAEEPGSSVGMYKQSDSAPEISLETSFDEINWTPFYVDDTEIVLENIGDKVYFRGINDTMASDSWESNTFYMSGQIAASGSIMSLLDGTGNSTVINYGYCFSALFYDCASLTTAPELPATTLAESCYESMFDGCKSLTTAPELPATTLAEGCYSHMFWECSSLVEAPELPAVTLAERCYECIFYDCTSLTTAPELPATTLAYHCYTGMFLSCTSLTIAPELPADILAEGCYIDMFNYCTSLTTAPELPATILAKDCYLEMFQDCTSLTKAPELPVTTLADSCYFNMFVGCTGLTQAPDLPATTLAPHCYQFMFKFCPITTIPTMAVPNAYVADCYRAMFDDIKTLDIYSAPQPGYTKAWTCVNAKYCTGMFGSYDKEPTWAQLDGQNFPNNGTPVTGMTYYFKDDPVPTVDSDYLIKGSTLTAIGDAIRGKTGGTAELSPAEMAESITEELVKPSGTVTLTQQSGTDVSQYASASVRSGSLALNTPSVSSSGLITASASLSTSGWVDSAPTSKTYQMTTQAGKTVTPSTSQQTAVASGRYTTGAVYVAAVPTETKTVAANGTVTPTSGKFLSSVTVAIPTYDGTVV